MSLLPNTCIAFCFIVSDFCFNDSFWIYNVSMFRMITLDFYLYQCLLMYHDFTDTRNYPVWTYFGRFRRYSNGRLRKVDQFITTLRWCTFKSAIFAQMAAIAFLWLDALLWNDTCRYTTQLSIYWHIGCCSHNITDWSVSHLRPSVLSCDSSACEMWRGGPVIYLWSLGCWFEPTQGHVSSLIHHEFTSHVMAIYVVPKWQLYYTQYNLRTWQWHAMYVHAIIAYQITYGL